VTGEILISAYAQRIRLYAPIALFLEDSLPSRLSVKSAARN
jgi:hypothetical protein